MTVDEALAQVPWGRRQNMHNEWSAQGTRRKGLPNAYAFYVNLGLICRLEEIEPGCGYYWYELTDLGQEVLKALDEMMDATMMYTAARFRDDEP